MLMQELPHTHNKLHTHLQWIPSLPVFMAINGQQGEEYFISLNTGELTSTSTPK